MKVNVVGKDWEGFYLWEGCYLTGGGSENRRKQVLSDVEKYINSGRVLTIGELITIDLEDHSSGFEQFEITGIFPKSKIVRMLYIGGGSLPTKEEIIQPANHGKRSRS